MDEAEGAGTEEPGVPEIRPLVEVDEFRACVEIQQEVWGEDFVERVPPGVLKVAALVGGVSSGAFVGERLVGFVFGLTGVEGDGPVHWSHMLAVRPGHRGSGLGRRLKSHQRDVLLARGITRCYWTFDPLEGRNGWLNLGRLGAVVRRYVPEMYGDSGSPLHAGVGTDRFIAVWDMDSDRVAARMEGGEDPPGREDVADLPAAFDLDRRGRVPLPVGPHRIPPDRPFLVPVPMDLERLLKREPEAARRWRDATRPLLGDALDGTREVRELIRMDDEVGAYLVMRR